MYIIGLTGGIASGKSTVSQLLKEQGAYIVDADQIAHEIVQPGRTALKEISEVFGETVLTPDGSLNRRRLGELVFHDSALREKLNGIMHGRIKEQMIAAIEKAKTAGYNIVVLDVPLLIEVGWQYMADTIWVVFIGRDQQSARLIARDHLTPREAEERLNSQLSLDEKMQYADVMIDNSGTMEETAAQVSAALAKLSAEAKT